MASLDYDLELSRIPEREWRLLKVLARKREEKAERENLAEQFRKMWLQEKEGRKLVEAQTNQQYKRFINWKRENDHEWLEQRRMQLTLEQQMRKGLLMDAIRHKEQKADELLAWRGDQRATELVNRVIEDEARALLAAERRHQQQFMDQLRKKQELEHWKNKSDEAIRRKNCILRDSSRRLAASSAVNNWETAMIREQLAASDAERRARYSALAMLAEERGDRVMRALDEKRHRARVNAAHFERLRDEVRHGRY